MEPPKHLSDMSKELYNQFVPKPITAPGRILLFVQALEFLDTAEAFRKARQKHGVLVKSKRSGLDRANPCVAQEQKARKAFIKLWQRLDLHRELIPLQPFDDFTEWKPNPSEPYPDERERKLIKRLAHL